MDIKQKGTNADKSRYRNRVRNSVEGDHDSGGKPITHSGAKPISDSGLKAIGNRSPAEWWAALFRDLALARADGSFRSVLARLSRLTYW